MGLVYTWSAIIRPGRADRYFAEHGHTAFDPANSAYDNLTAWWMAELCRLVYRRGPEETSQPLLPTRQTILENVGLVERLFVGDADAECSIVGPRPGFASDFQIVVFRGVDRLRDWLDFVLDVGPSPWPAGGLVHKGFREAFELVWPRLSAALRPDVPIIYTGHSLGGALTALATSTRPPTAAYTFGSAIIGDTAFARTLDGMPLYRVVNVGDLTARAHHSGLGHAGQLYYIASDGKLLVNPPPSVVAADRRQRPIVVPGRPLKSYILGPPHFAADHAPVNYVVRLERLVPPLPLRSAPVLTSAPLSFGNSSTGPAKTTV